MKKLLILLLILTSCQEEVKRPKKKYRVDAISLASINTCKYHLAGFNKDTTIISSCGLYKKGDWITLD